MNFRNVNTDFPEMEKSIVKARLKDEFTHERA